MPDLQSLHLPVMDQTLTTITPCKVGFVTHEALHELCLRYPRITSALLRETLIDASIFREWIVNTGQREGKQRVAHLLCEMVVRLRALGLSEDNTVPMPITQIEFSDAVGLSPVHMNRMIQELRADRLIRLQDGTLTALDWDALKQAGDFDPAYLHLRQE